MAALTEALSRNDHKKMTATTTSLPKQVKFAPLISSSISNNTTTLTNTVSDANSLALLSASSINNDTPSNNSNHVKGTILVQDYADPRRVKNVLVSMPSSDNASDHTYAKDDTSTVETSSSDDTMSSSDNESTNVKTTPIEENPVTKARGRPKKTATDSVHASLPPAAPQLKSILKPPTSIVEPKLTFERVKRRGRGCGNCEGCLREDCGNCSYCLDKPKFGGPGKKKQRCALRVCANFVSIKSNPLRSGLRNNSNNQSKSLALLSSVDTAKFLSDTTSLSQSISPSLSSVRSLSRSQQLLANNISIGSSPNSHGPLAATPSSRTNKKEVIGGGANDDVMKCIVCTRERKLNISRSDKFCSAKCLRDWELINPEKNPDNAESSDINLNFPLLLQATTDNKPVARALKNLQIDMALPGERHHESKSNNDLLDNLLTAMEDTNSLLSAVGNKRSHQDDSVTVTTPTKKPKINISSPVTSPVAPVTKTKKTRAETVDVSCWSIEDVVQYFESTGECSHIASVLGKQEVDGEALLLLSHDSLVKCLGMKLGPALKVMTHVDKLKNQSTSKN